MDAGTATECIAFATTSRAKVFNTATPHSLSAFLVDGQVAGSWKIERGKVKLQPFEPLAPVVRKQLDEEADRLAEFVAG